MKKIFILFLIISINVYGQKRIGNEVFNIEFLRIMDNIQGEQNDYYTDIVERSMFSKNDSLKYGFLSPGGKTIIEAKYTYASDFFNGKSNIIVDSIPGILFKDGTTNMFPTFDAAFWYKDDLGLVIKDKKYGFINKNGEIIIPLKYDDAFTYYNGYASVKTKDNWNYINRKGEVIFPDSLIFSSRPIIDNNAVFMISGIEVEEKKRMHSEERKGSRIMAEYLNQIKNIQLKEGLINTQGEVIIEPMYDEISGYFINGYMRVRNKGKAGIINEKGKIIIPLEYDNVLDYMHNMFTAEKDNKWGIIDINNKIIISFEYGRIRHFQNELALITEKGTGYVNPNNEVVIEPQYDFNLLGDFHNELALIKKDNKYGYINKDNQIMIPIIYENALPFYNDTAVVAKDGLTFFINKKGEKLQELVKPYLWSEKEGMIRYAE